MNEKDIKDNTLENKGKNLNLPSTLAIIPKQSLIKKAEKISAAVFLITNFLKLSSYLPHCQPDCDRKSALKLW